MTIDEMKNLKNGDQVVQVRSSFQNYDFTLIPIEPKLYTISGKSMDINLKESLKMPFKDERGHIVVHAGGCDRRIFCRDFETIDNFIKGKYNSNIILDNERWSGGLIEFLEFKRVKDLEILKEKIKNRKTSF